MGECVNMKFWFELSMLGSFVVATLRGLHLRISISVRHFDV